VRSKNIIKGFEMSNSAQTRLCLNMPISNPFSMFVERTPFAHIKSYYASVISELFLGRIAKHY